MNVAAFAVVVARERVSEHGDDLASFENLGQSQPWLAWPMTIAMLSLAGFPATAGFIGKFYLIDASVAGDYTWLGIVIVVGSVVSLAYYLRVVAVMWMGALRGRAADRAAAHGQAGLRLVARGRRCAPSPRWRRSRSCSRRRRSSSASGRTRCSTPPATWARRSRACASAARRGCPGAAGSAIRGPRPARRGVGPDAAGTPTGGRGAI